MQKWWEVFIVDILFWHPSSRRLVQVKSPDINPHLLSIKEGEKVGYQKNSSQENRIKARCLSCTSMVLKAVWGLLIILSVSSSWIGTTQIVKITYKNFYCPFFMTWFSTNWNIMFFPVYYSGHLATAQEKQSPMKKFRYVLCKWPIGDVLK